MLIGTLAGLSAQPSGRQDASFMISLATEILDRRGEVIIQLYSPDPSMLKSLQPWISLDHPVENGWRAYADREGFAQLVSSGIDFQVLEPGRNRRKSSPVSGSFPGDWNRYPTHTEYVDALLQLAADYPQICRLDTIGESVSGRKILVVKISDHPGIDEAEPVCYYSSTMHGDEPSGFVLLTRLIYHLCESYGLDAQITRLVDGLEIWINPLANPDGTYFNGDDSILVPKRFNLNNVDLNRGFPDIRLPEPEDYDIYEPENQAQIHFMRLIRPHLSANLHGGQEVVNYPYDTWSSLHADDAWFRRISRRFADSAQARSVPLAYMGDLDNGITNGWAWYQVIGSRQDWITWFQQGREVTLEISAEKFPDPAILPFYWHYLQVSLVEYLEQAMYGISGTVHAIDDAAPLEAEIRVTGHDTLQSQVYTDSLNGFFVRLIDTGIWDLEISAAEYQPALVSGLHMLPDSGIWLDIGLHPETSSGTMDPALTAYPNPFQSGLNVRFISGKDQGYDLRLYNAAGQQVYCRTIHATAGHPFELSLDLPFLPPGIYFLQLQSPERSRYLLIHKSR